MACCSFGIPSDGAPCLRQRRAEPDPRHGGRAVALRRGLEHPDGLVVALQVAVTDAKAVRAIEGWADCLGPFVQTESHRHTPDESASTWRDPAARRADPASLSRPLRIPLRRPSGAPAPRAPRPGAGARAPTPAPSPPGAETPARRDGRSPRPCNTARPRCAGRSGPRGAAAGKRHRSRHP